MSSPPPSPVPHSDIDASLTVPLILFLVTGPCLFSFVCLMFDFFFIRLRAPPLRFCCMRRRARPASAAPRPPPTEPPRVAPRDFDNVTECEVKGGTCPVCLEAMGKGCARLACDHTFHADCVKAWLAKKRSCPVCRMPVFAHVSPQPAAAAPPASGAVQAEAG